MAEFSKEWCDANPDKGLGPDFSVEEVFQNLKKGDTEFRVCEGFEFTKILDIGGVCHVLDNDGKLKTFKEVSGIEYSKNDNTRKLLVLGIIGIFIAWSLTFTLFKIFRDSQDRGTFGDMFGAVNALFSGTAAILMFYAIRLQSKELSQTNREMSNQSRALVLQNKTLELQHQEQERTNQEMKIQSEALKLQSEMLSLQKDELKDTRKEFVQQNETLGLQRFENTFFQMLSLHHEIVDKLEYGTFALVKARLYDEMSRSIDIQTNWYDSSKHISTNLNAFNKFVFYYNKASKDHKQSLSNYFRNLYHIFKFVHTSPAITDEKRPFYASIARAQLSQDELFLLFYNSMAPGYGNPKFLFLIKKYDIMQNFDDSELSNHMDYHTVMFEELIEQVTDILRVSNPEHVQPKIEE